MPENPSTEIEQSLERGRLVLRESSDFAKVRDAMSTLPVADTERTSMVPFPDLPSPVVLADKAKAALARLKDVFAVVQPDERRALTQEESKALYDERETLDAILDLLGKRRDDIGTLVKHHMDVTAEKEGRAFPVATDDEDGHHPATERDVNGNYILAAEKKPERSNIVGTDQAWSREFRKGKMTFSARVAAEMLDAGEISRDAYLAMTREERVFDENKAMLAAQKPGLQEDVLKVIKRGTGYSAPGTSLYVRKAK